MKKIFHQRSGTIFKIFLLGAFFLLSYFFWINLKIVRTKAWAGCCWPTPTATPTPTFIPTPTPTSTPTIIPTSTPTFVPTPTPTPSQSCWPEPTLTPTPTIIPTFVPTSTPTPTPTSILEKAEEPGVGGPGPAGAPVCTCPTPDTPTLLSVTPIGPREVELIWTAVANTTHYSISYGPSSGNYLFGVPNTGKVTSFRVGNLDPAINYCFAVRAVNDCAPGSLSNEICMGRVLGAVAPSKVLGVTTLAETGSFDRENLQLIIFTLGCLCVGFGLNLLFPKKSELLHLAKD